MTLEEYASKVEVFIDMWRNKLITDFEFVENVDSLTKSIAYANGWDMIHNYMDPPVKQD